MIHLYSGYRIAQIDCMGTAYRSFSSAEGGAAACGANRSLNRTLRSVPVSFDVRLHQIHRLSTNEEIFDAWILLVSKLIDATARVGSLFVVCASRSGAQRQSRSIGRRAKRGESGLERSDRHRREFNWRCIRHEQHRQFQSPVPLAIRCQLCSARPAASVSAKSRSNAVHIHKDEA